MKTAHRANARVLGPVGFCDKRQARGRKATRTTWLPAEWGIICTNKLGGRGWRFEAWIGARKVAKNGGFESNRAATSAAKRAIRAYAYVRLKFFVGARCYHAGFGGKILCGRKGRPGSAIGPSDRVQISDVDCSRCGAILNAIEAEMKGD